MVNGQTLQRVKQHSEVPIDANSKVLLSLDLLNLSILLDWS